MPTIQYTFKLFFFLYHNSGSIMHPGHTLGISFKTNKIMISKALFRLWKRCFSTEREKQNVYIQLYQNDFIITRASVIKVFNVDMPYEWRSFNCGTNAPQYRVMT